MKPEIAQKILADVTAAYDAIAPSFAETRLKPWPVMAEFAATIEPGSRVLDAGCGNGRACQLFADRAIEYCGVDVSERLLDFAKQDCRDLLTEFRVGSVLALPYEDASFDTVILVASLHHVPSSRLRLQAMREVARVLKPGGRVFMTNWWLWHGRRWQSFWRSWPGKIFGGSGLDWNDVLIPWKRGTAEPVARYYHGFTRGEARRLCVAAGMEILDNRRLVEEGGREANLVTVCRKPIG
ncbi:MAG: class I SAM-dependent methyltransferase [Patescibacteria group bacterium]|nr:class I SAM-dependent methyltransferase [Patescibacteria group bacterium]